MNKDGKLEFTFDEEMIKVQMLGLQIQSHVSHGKLTEVVYSYMGHFLFSPLNMQGISQPRTSLPDTVHVIFLCSLIPAFFLQFDIKAGLRIKERIEELVS